MFIFVDAFLPEINQMKKTGSKIFIIFGKFKRMKGRL